MSSKGCIGRFATVPSDSPWYALAAEILDLDARDTPKQSVSDYDESMSVAPDPVDVIHEPVEELEVSADASGQKASSGWINWGGPPTAYRISDNSRLHHFLPGALIVGVAGALHPNLGGSPSRSLSPG